jgi:arylformamidase
MGAAALSMIYRDFDQQELDMQYNAQATVGDILPFIEAYIAQSNDARVAGEFHDSLAFGPSAEETLDLFPAGENTPLIVFVHGGYWRMLSKNESSFMAPNFVDKGIAVAAVNYTLRPAATLDEIVTETRRSISWLYQNGADYGCDPDRIYIAGSSAGGHLAAMLVSGGWQENFCVPSDVIKGGMLLSGLFDLEPVALSYANEWMELDSEAAKRNSPVHFLPDQGCPLVISYGGSETLEFKRQSQDYAAKWQAAGFDVDCFEVTERNHFDIPLELAKPDSVLAQKMLDIISG